MEKLSFLQNKLTELLEEVDLAIRQRIWWQQDGATLFSSYCDGIPQ